MKKIELFILLVLLTAACGQRENQFKKSWTGISDRVWAGKEFWSNRLQDWKVQNGRLECTANNPDLRMRTTHLINFRLAEREGDFYARVETGALQNEANFDAACGILVGAGAQLDVLGASLVQQKPGPGAGLFAGISAGGDLFVRDMETGENLKTVRAELSEMNVLQLETARKKTGNSIRLKCGNVELFLAGIGNDRLTGNIALVSHPGTGGDPATYWFNNLEVRGSKLEKQDLAIGPIISTQHTLSNNILKMTAQMAPVGDKDPRSVFLEISEEGNWTEISKTMIITPGYTATFRVGDWNSSRDTPYRIKYIYNTNGGKTETAYWGGTVRHDPVEKDKIVIAGFTGNHNIAHPGLSGTEGTFSFNPAGIWYPHTEVADHVRVQDPDVLFFSGDQVYEGNSPTFPDRENYELDYLYKWYLYCLAFRNLTRDIPTVSIPDDHDVYQGNLWGQGGRPTDRGDKGGYVHPAWFVNMVERIQCSNLPDPYDPAPIDQGIGVYFTSITYGGIGIAVLEDRKFKSGCADNPFVTTGRPDHVIDPAFDVRRIDLPGKKLLGERQLNFLNDWACKWEGQQMKIALSQTIFANMATHHGSKLTRLVADLDSNGWPQTGRNRAIDALRKAFVFHLAGDQHLASLVHHGIDDWDDAIYSFCVPSIANFYPRAWWPDTPGKNRPEGAPANMGKHRDGFGHPVTVYGVTNPSGFTGVSTLQEPLVLHDRMPGYGIVVMNKSERTIRMECWPRYADPEHPEQQYDGWPKTISQFDNYGKGAYAFLPVIRVEGTEDPVIEILNEKTGQLVYCVRIKGSEFRPKVFKTGSYKLILKDTQRDISKAISGIRPAQDKNEVLDVRLY